MSNFILRIGMLAATVLLFASAALAQGIVTDVSLRTDSSSLQARVCPVTIAFDGFITMNGPGTVTYRIVRSDGATGPVQTLEFLKPGTQTVHETWTVGDATLLPHYEGWVAIQVLTPNEVESNHADAAFHMTCSAAQPQPPPQPRRAHFRVSLTGFTCFRETRDHFLSADGPGDEIYQAPYVLVVDRSGATSEASAFAFGPTFRPIRTGTRFPTATPHILSSAPIGLGIPGVLFDGELIEGERAVAIGPTLWEFDGSKEQLSRFFGFCTAARSLIASATIPIMTGGFPARFGGLGTPLDGLITVPIAPEGDRDRPVGISVTGSVGFFSPQFILLTYEGAMATAGAASFGGDVFAIRYAEPESHQGDYTLFVKVELIP